MDDNTRFDGSVPIVIEDWSHTWAHVKCTHVIIRLCPSLFLAKLGGFSRKHQANPNKNTFLFNRIRSRTPDYLKYQPKLNPYFSNFLKHKVPKLPTEPEPEGS